MSGFHLKYVLFYCVFSVFSGLRAQSPILSVDSDDFSDLAFLDQQIAEKRLVMLGESSHGINDFNTLKYRMVRYLHEKHGFRVVVFESGFGNCGFTNEIKDSLSGMEMLVYSLMGIWRVSGNCEMMNYLRDNQMHLAGVDPNDNALFFNADKYSLLFDDSSLVKQISEADSLMFYKFTSVKSAAYSKMKQPDVRELSETATMLTTKYETIYQKLPPNSKKNILIRRAIRNKLSVLSTSANLKEERYFVTNRQRDSLMADNLTFLLDTLYPDQKIIFCAHNAHIAKIPMNKHYNGNACTSSFLSKDLLEKSFIIGIYASSGEYTPWLDKPEAIKMKKKTLEYKYRPLSQKGVYYPIDFFPDRKKYNQGFPGFAIQLKQMYDGIVVLQDVKGRKIIQYNKSFSCE